MHRITSVSRTITSSTRSDSTRTDSTRTSGIRLIALMAAAACVLAAGCSDDESDETTTTEAAAQDQQSDDATSDAGDQVPGPFQLTTADGSLDIAGTVVDCSLIDDTSAVLTFSGSVQEVTVDASGATGTVTVTDEFDGVIDTVAVDTETGDVRITGTGTTPSAGSETTEFEVRGRCEV